MEAELIATIAAKTDASNVTVHDDFEGDLLDEIDHGIVESNPRTINLQGDQFAGPITSAVVVDATNDPSVDISPEQYQRRKPVFVKASLNKSNLKPAELIENAIELEKVIKNRGNSSTKLPIDCTYIVPPSLNGFMVDYNLFPQHVHENKGSFNNYVFSKCLEAIIRAWLTLIPQSYDPRVEFSVLLLYTCSQKPDCPQSFKYLIRFYAKGHKEERDVKDSLLLKAGNEILNIANRAIKNRSRNTLRQEADDVIRRFHMQEQHKINVLTMVEELEQILSEVEEITSVAKSTSPPSLSPPSESSSAVVQRNRSTNIIDFIPIAGGVKSVYHGAQDFSDGNILSAIGNTALGMTSLAADMVTLGAMSTVGKAVVKGSTVTIASTVAKGMFAAKLYSGVTSYIFRR